ncbi:MAG TPA: hypothetical protein VEW69_09835, partial [Alphaproteobacteria bacterium]|nr:hypothetical protein [Alphaproteobacteria bacterium]
TNYTLQFPSCAFNCSGINQLPVAVVQNVTVVSAVPGGSANASIDNGSFDPDDATNTLTFTQTPPGPYPHGTTTVMLTVTDPKGAAAQASATVTVIDPSPNPDLTVAKTHSGNFAQGQVGATYTITVSNVGALPTVGTATMTDILPASLTPTAASGTGWTCGIVTQTVTCTRSDALAAVSSYPAITLTVTVATNAPASVTNTANVTGGGEVNLGNDSSSNPTTITPVDNFSFNPTLPSVSVTAGQSVTEHITFTPTPSTGSTINFSCSNLPPLTSCSFSPASVPPSTTPVDIAMTITTTATTTAALQRPRVFYAAWVPLSSLGLVGIVLVGTRRRNRKKVVGLAALSLVLGLLLVNGCGGSKHVPVTNPGTPPGSYTITTTATSPNVTKSTTFTLVVN